MTHAVLRGLCVGTVLAVAWGGLHAAAVLAESERASDLRVMSFNIRFDNPADGEDAWEHRRENFAETIRDFDPDLLGTQEVLASQAVELKEDFPDYVFYGVGRKDGVAEGEFAAVLYRADRFEKIAAGHFWLSETPHVPGSRSWDSALPRMVTWVRLLDRETDRQIVLANTHWDHRGIRARIESARILREFIDGLPEGVLVLAIGDFNVREDDVHYRVMTHGTVPDARRLIDTYREAHPERSPEEATYHGFRGRTRGSRIDWILASPEWRVLEAGIDRRHFDGRYPSDHYPVTAVLRLRGDG